MTPLLPRGTTMPADLVFPQSLAEKYRPRTIAEFIGLDKPKKILAKFAAKPYWSAWLFVGPSGVGKTSIAIALASQIGAELHHLPSGKCNAQSIEETVRLCHYLPMTSGGTHLVLVDEADGMTNLAQLALLSKLDVTAFPPNTIFVFTCNGTEGLEPRFISVAGSVEFSSYGMAAEITALLLCMDRQLGQGISFPHDAVCPAPSPVALRNQIAFALPLLLDFLSRSQRLWRLSFSDFPERLQAGRPALIPASRLSESECVFRQPNTIP